MSATFQRRLAFLFFLVSQTQGLPEIFGRDTKNTNLFAKTYDIYNQESDVVHILKQLVQVMQRNQKHTSLYERVALLERGSSSTVKRVHEMEQAITQISSKVAEMNSSFEDFHQVKDFMEESYIKKEILLRDFERKLSVMAVEVFRLKDLGAQIKLFAKDKLQNNDQTLEHNAFSKDNQSFLRKSYAKHKVVSKNITSSSGHAHICDGIDIDLVPSVNKKHLYSSLSFTSSSSSTSSWCLFPSSTSLNYSKSLNYCQSKKASLASAFDLQFAQVIPDEKSTNWISSASNNSNMGVFARNFLHRQSLQNNMDKNSAKIFDNQNTYYNKEVETTYGVKRQQTADTFQDKKDASEHLHPQNSESITQTILTPKLKKILKRYLKEELTFHKLRTQHNSDTNQLCFNFLVKALNISNLSLEDGGHQLTQKLSRQPERTKNIFNNDPTTSYNKSSTLYSLNLTLNKKLTNYRSQLNLDSQDNYNPIKLKESPSNTSQKECLLLKCIKGNSCQILSKQCSEHHMFYCRKNM